MNYFISSGISKIVKLFCFTTSMLTFSFISSFTFAQIQQIPINNWTFTYLNHQYPAKIPGNIHLDLLKNKLINDPFFGNNENFLQWISDTAWSYTATFEKKDILSWNNAEIIFEGIDCHAYIYLNNKPLDHNEGHNNVDNSFREWHFPIYKDSLKPTNTLRVVFWSTKKYDELKAAQLPYSLPENRAFSRKPQYQYGWDWGPKLITCGIWKPVYIKSWKNVKIENVKINQIHFSTDTAKYGLGFYIMIDEDCIKKNGYKNLSYNVSCNNKVVYSKQLSVTQNDYPANDNPAAIIYNYVSLDFFNPKLWYPNSEGNQNFYDIKIDLCINNKVYDSYKTKIGIRKVELIEEKDSIGSSFYFKVNDIPIFMKGANWIPADFFPARVNKSIYRTLLIACKEAEINMLRVWGGGYYEDDYFYDLCDSLGLLVWQDFMFACALYPADRTFINQITQEAIEQIKRIKNHPCIALWCGNNEVKNGWEDWGWQSQYTDNEKTVISQNMDKIFGQLLPDLVLDNDSGRAYISSSPLWGWGHKECKTEGDSHYWGVWWGEEPFEAWKSNTGRFMSEFGFQSYPQINTFAEISFNADLNLNSDAIKNHQKHSRGKEIIEKAMQQYFNIPVDFDEYIYVSQLVQAFGIGEALQSFRRAMPYCMGALLWQFNDCWQATSWSAIDYCGYKKALYYEIKRQFKKTIITSDKFCSQQASFSVTTDNKSNIEGYIAISLMDFTGKTLEYNKIDTFKAKALSTTKIIDYDLNEKFIANKNNLYLKIQFISKNNKIIAEKFHYFVYPKELNLKKPKIDITVKIKGNEYIISLLSSTLAKSVELTVDKGESTFSDNFLDLEAGITKKVILKVPAKKVNPCIKVQRSYRFVQ